VQTKNSYTLYALRAYNDFLDIMNKFLLYEFVIDHIFIH